MEMRSREGLSLQRGMNFNATPTHSIVLSSHRPGAPYEGHDEHRTRDTPNPKQLDQPLHSKNGKLTQNGLFHEAAQAYIRSAKPPVRVRVYEKIKDGIWSYNGLFQLVDSWTGTSGGRRVFKFKLHSIPDEESDVTADLSESEQRRIIPSHVKLAVWKRDKGACVECGSKINLHLDHILPFSKGGTSETEANIQLLCMKHNIQKGAKLL
jgi:hypothetical protein